jgi:hypothetical protein
MTTATIIISEVRDILDEPSAAQWTDANLRKWVNEAGRDLARSTRHVKRAFTINALDGVSSYTLDPTIIAVEHAAYEDAGGRRYPLIARHWENMDSVWGHDATREGIPAVYTALGVSPAVQLVVYPVPDASTGVFKLMTAVLPAAIALDGTDDDVDLDIPPAWYDALADYCEFKALRKDRDPRWQEAYQLYQEKRDGLIHNPDYIAANREVVVDFDAGYLPRWLVEFD